MTTRWTPRRSDRRTIDAVPLHNTQADRARKLPMFGPGIVITVPLSLLPAYLALYQLEPRGVSATGTLLVKRVPKDKKNV